MDRVFTLKVASAQVPQYVLHLLVTVSSKLMGFAVYILIPIVPGLMPVAAGPRLSRRLVTVAWNELTMFDVITKVSPMVAP